MLRTSDLDYDLPEGFIARTPAQPRDSARLMVVPRALQGSVQHRIVRDLPRILREGDLLVVNTTRVLPARFRGRRADTAGRVEGLFLETDPQNNWKVMLRSNGRLRPDLELLIGEPTGLILKLVRRENELWIAQPTVSTTGDTKSEPPHEPPQEFPHEPPEVILQKVGLTPLPPYILRARRGDDPQQQSWSDELDRQWYQTVYASESEPGAVAAPTAGLHFTGQLLDELEKTGVKRAEIVLHVGAGTFKPVETEFVEQHPMHKERFYVPAAACDAIRETRAGGGRVVAVGTTTARALESLPALVSGGTWGETELLITPGYAFRHFDALMTNFHLPRSTLLAMVGAFIEGGISRLLDIYQQAIREKYRFYSYGDAMLILP